MSQKSNKSAFPVSGMEANGSYCMTLRDYFAAQAIPYLISEGPVEGWAEYVAGAAYHLADAMLEARSAA